MLVLLYSVLAILGAMADNHSDPCACTGDNSLIPKKKKKFADTDYGVKCGDWDMTQRFCTNPKSLLEANRACWCPKFWCWVDGECSHAMKSTFFKESGLYFSYQTCGNTAEKCFDEDDDIESEFEKAIKEDHSDDDEHTVEDVVHALVTLTINVNELTKVVNSLSQQVSVLNREVLELNDEAAIVAPENPNILPTTNTVDGYTETTWMETACPMGYRTIGTEKGCDIAGPALGYDKKDNNNEGMGEKLCVYDSDERGYLMSRTYGGDEQKLICQKVRKD